jgi:hypothetical protein
MTSVPSNMPYVYRIDSSNYFPTLPGAFMISEKTGSFPIFCSISDFKKWGMQYMDNFYIIMPGYKLWVYNDTGETTSIGSYSSTNITYFAAPYPKNTSVSCRLYFGSDNSEIKIENIS